MCLAAVVKYAFMGIGYHENASCVKHFLHKNSMTQRRYEKQDNGRRVLKWRT